MKQGVHYLSIDTDDSGDWDTKEVKLREKLAKNLPDRMTYEKLVEGLKQGKYRKVVVATGAGISVSAGIPDFRCPKTGLYANLQGYDLPRPESMFDLEYFSQKPQAFYRLANDFLDTSKFMPTPTHHFIKLLENKGLLQLNLTQNIDNLESKAGISPDKLVQAHGANVGASCARCKRLYSRSKLDKAFKTQTILQCDGKFKPHSYYEDEVDCKGFIKPNIVFFGEPLPEHYFKGMSVVRNDDKKPQDGFDLMIICGTALAVKPFSKIADAGPKETPKVLFNMENTEVNGYDFDDPAEHPQRMLVKGKCDETIWQLCRDLGWDRELQQLIEECQAK